MQDARGGYYSTLDADSEHEEGKFYVWTPEELDAVLGPEESALAKRVFGLTQPANFEGKHWHLYLAEAPEAAAAALGIEPVRAQSCGLRAPVRARIRGFLQLNPPEPGDCA